MPTGAASTSCAVEADPERGPDPPCQEKPRWLLAIPDAVKQLERLKRENLTRRDLEILFDVSRVTAAKLMKRFGRRA